MTTAAAIASPRPRPTAADCATYYGRYLSLAEDMDVLDALRRQLDETQAFFATVSDAQAAVLHPPYTWTIKQVVNHVTDGERIFSYRALRFARGDITPLPGFDENEYARAALTERLPLATLVGEFASVRRASLTLFENLPPESWSRCGTANGLTISVAALAHILLGHARHHFGIVRQRLAR